VGGIPPRPSEIKMRPAPPPLANARPTKEKFCFPFRRKNRRAQIKHCEQNWSG